MLSRFFRDRVELFAFVGLIDALNGFSARLTSMLRAHDVAGALLGTGGISVAGWFAFYAIATIAREEAPDDAIRRDDAPLAMLMLALAILPAASASGVGLLIGGIRLALTSPAASRGRRIAAILLALTGPVLMGRLLLGMFAPAMLATDAHLAAWLIGAPVSGNVIPYAGAPGGIYVGAGCSSLHNMSLAVVLWTTVVQLLRLRVTPKLIATGAAAAAAMGAVNIVRLAALASHPSDFIVLHSGYGAELFGFASLIITGLVIGWGVGAAARDQA